MLTDVKEPEAPDRPGYSTNERQMMFPPAHRLLVAISLACLFTTTLSAQTIGLLQNEPTSFEGYTLFCNSRYPEVYLVDNNGYLVHSWASTNGSPGYLLESGNLIRSAGGGLQEMDWDGNLVWEFVYSEEDSVQHHHDIARLPNGNVLMIAQMYKTSAEAIAAGRDPALLTQSYLLPEHIIEVEQTGANSGIIVWQWHLWDHLIQDFDATKMNYGVVAVHPELFDLNFAGNGNSDWIHANAINYNEELDQIILNSRSASEFWIIDHSTTTSEAAGHTGGNSGEGGDILYRWGNPQAYGRGSDEDQKLFGEHDVQWIAAGLPGAGNILIFNNGNGRPDGEYSTVEELEIPVGVNGLYPDLAPGATYGPFTPTYIYAADPPESFYSSIISGVQRQPNGHTLICEGTSGEIQEVDSAGNIVWKYINPVSNTGPMTQGDTPSGNSTFRATRYAPDYAGFAGRDLTPGPPIELYDSTGVEGDAGPRRFALKGNYPNPFNPSTTIVFELATSSHVIIDVYSADGRKVVTILDETRSAGQHSVGFAPLGLSSGVYFYRLAVGNVIETNRMTLVK